MIFVFGSRLYGKVDEVPGLFHVATKFAHLWYIPLLPLGSHLVLSEDEDGGWRGVKIPFSFKSLLVAWLRTGLVVASLWAGFSMVMSFMTAGIISGFVHLILLGLFIAGFVFSKRVRLFNGCNLERARELAEKAGFDQDGIALLEAHFMAMEAAAPIEPR